MHHDHKQWTAGLRFKGEEERAAGLGATTPATVANRWPAVGALLVLLPNGRASRHCRGGGEDDMWARAN